MSYALAEDKWNHTAALLAAIANTVAPEFTPDDFHPFTNHDFNDDSNRDPCDELERAGF